MRDSVLAAFTRFSEPFEGVTTYLYLDSREPRGLVTIGVGNLCPLALALTLPFCTPKGALATRSEVAAAWAAVDNAQSLKALGGGAFAKLTTIRLSRADVDRMVFSKLDEMDAELKSRVGSAWSRWPASAQLALLSWAWAVGPKARAPRMFAALAQDDFVAASSEVEVNPKRGTILLRNAANVMLLRNAGFIVSRGLDVNTLEWRTDLAKDAETEPSLLNPASEPTVYPAPNKEKNS